MWNLSEIGGFRFFKESISHHKNIIIKLNYRSMSSAIEQAMRQICEEKGLAYESVLEAIQVALAAAYRKDFGDKMQNIETEFDASTGAVKAFDIKTVVEDIPLEALEAAEVARRERAEAFALSVETARQTGQDLSAVSFEEDNGPRFNPKTEIMLTEAKAVNPEIELGEILRQELEIPGDFGRMAAMTAKQVITQKLREAEREIVFSEFKQFEGEIINGTIQRRDGRVLLVDLGRTVGVLRTEDQVPQERYNPGDRIKVYVKSVSLGSRGPEILLSRTSEELVRRLFAMEIPEVHEGVVQIKALVREGGARSKVAVATDDTQIDPIGACIGQRGTRIQTIIAELSGEKIDIIEWDADPKKFIINSLSPAKISSVELNEEEMNAVVWVSADQLSLAIGKGGQNVRLASRLTGWRIDIREAEGVIEEETEKTETEEVAPEVASSEEPVESSQE